MAKITIDWGDNVKIKEEYEVPYEVARCGGKGKMTKEKAAERINEAIRTCRVSTCFEDVEAFGMALRALENMPEEDSSSSVKDVNAQRYEVTNDAIETMTPVAGCSKIFQRNIIMPKEIFIEAYTRWIKNNMGD